MRVLMERLYRQRMIEKPIGKAKSVALTDEGPAESKRLFSKHFRRR